MSVEDNFVMLERAADGSLITFNVIEDESGDIFWGFGHQEAEPFIDEINRWLVHAVPVTDPDDLLHPQTHKVEHKWARMTDDDERFELVEPTGTEADAFVFPVTRLML